MNRRRIELARAWGRGLLAIAVLLAAYPLVEFIAAPQYTDLGASRVRQPDAVVIPGTTLIYAIGIAGVLFGLACMWRLYKAPTKYEGAHWRFRDHD